MDNYLCLFVRDFDWQLTSFFLLHICRSQGLLPQQWVDAARLCDAGVFAHSLVAALRRVGGLPSRVPGCQVRALGRVQERPV